MTDTLFDDGLNPRYVSHAPVFLDELDPLGRLPHASLEARIAAAVDAFHASSGGVASLDVLRDIQIEHLGPVIGSGTLRVDIWLESLDRTTATYGFLCSSEDGNRAYARGERTVVKLDPQLRRPSSWSPEFLERQSALLKTLHAYA